MNETPDNRRVVKLPDYLDENGALTCPKCGFQEFEITNTYAWSEGCKRRRRVCENCRHPITTVEQVDETQ